MARARSCDGLAVAVSEDMPLADNVAGDIVGIRSDLDLALKLMASLPEAQQRVVRLSSVGGCSNDEIAELTGFSPANVRTLLSRGRKRIRELFIKYSE
ncbi:MAG: sigma-70 region 4 domain-containing protein [Paramuribaculum sp.]|nr:sigma-70 region 4 domain-containing protein [Paramuribaculum sp.]